MKNAGLIILVLGVIIILFSGFNREAKEKVIETGEIEMTAENSNSGNWLPMAGVAVMTMGGIIFIVGGKER